MKTSGETKAAVEKTEGDDPITAYSGAQSPVPRATCEALRELIARVLPGATSKVWHGSPVWFIDENPVVGYSANAKGVKLLFWNGQSFDEPALEPMGKHHAAQVVISDPAEIDDKSVRRWLKKAGADVLDSRAFFKQLREAKRTPES